MTTTVSPLRPVRVITPEDEQLMAREAHKRASKRRAEIASGQHQVTVLYAEIKKTSKYADQSEPGAKFPVTIQYRPGDCDGSYVIRGGPGGQYRPQDVSLYALLDDGRFQQIT